MKKIIIISIVLASVGCTRVRSKRVQPTKAKVHVSIAEELIPALRARLTDGDSTPYLMEVSLKNDTLCVEFNNFYK
jgi:hypothetical protein